MFEFYLNRKKVLRLTFELLPELLSDAFWKVYPNRREVLCLKSEILPESPKSVVFLKF